MSFIRKFVLAKCRDFSSSIKILVLKSFKTLVAHIYSSGVLRMEIIAINDV